MALSLKKGSSSFALCSCLLHDVLWHDYNIYNPPVAGIHSGWDAVLELCPHSRLQWFLSPGYKCWLSLYCCSLRPLLPRGNHCWRLRLVGCRCSPDENLSPCLKIYCWGWSFLEASRHQQWRKEGSLQKIVTRACASCTWTVNEPYPPRPRCYAQLLDAVLHRSFTRSSTALAVLEGTGMKLPFTTSV